MKGVIYGLAAIGVIFIVGAFGGAWHLEDGPEFPGAAAQPIPQVTEKYCNDLRLQQMEWFARSYNLSEDDEEILSYVISNAVVLSQIDPIAMVDITPDVLPVGAEYVHKSIPSPGFVVVVDVVRGSKFRSALTYIIYYYEPGKQRYRINVDGTAYYANPASRVWLPFHDQEKIQEIKNRLRTQVVLFNQQSDGYRSDYPKPEIKTAPEAEEYFK